MVAHRGRELVAGGEVLARQQLVEKQVAPGIGPIVSPARTGSWPHVSPYLGGMTEELCLLCVHAHPDDESSKGAGTVAKYHSEGAHCVLVCCTGGEEGDVLNPAMDKPEVPRRPARHPGQRAQAAGSIIGYDEVVMLGYRDSGMPGSEANERPESFARRPWTKPPAGSWPSCGERNRR